MEIQYNCTMHRIVLYSEIICILIDKELRNLTSSKLLKFIMQDWSKIETCIISLQEATNHWLLLQLNIFKRIQSTQVSLKVTQKPNTLLLDKYLRTASKCINSFFFCWHSKYRNIYQYYKHTTCVKNKRWLNSITNFENLYKYCVFITMTQQTQKTWEISTRHGKQKQIFYHVPMLIKLVLRVMMECKLNKQHRRHLQSR